MNEHEQSLLPPGEEFPDEVLEIGELLALDGPEESAFAMDPAELDRLVRMAIPALAKSTPMSVIQTVCCLYAHYVDSVEEDTRGDMIRDVYEQAMNGTCNPAALKAIVFLEENALLVEDAAAGFFYCESRNHGSSLPFVSDLLLEVTEASPYNLAGVFAAAVNTGEQGVLELLRRLRRDLSPRETDLVARLTAATRYSASILFLIDWLGEIDPLIHPGRFNSIATAIGLTRNLSDTFSTKFAPRKDSTDGFGPWVYSEIDSEVFAQMIEEPLRRIASRTEPNHIMRWVLRVWGFQAGGEVN